jgi:uncharacterized peroxidase-related enzyme
MRSHHVASIEELRADPAEWESYQAELRLTDNAAGDGLPDARDYGVPGNESNDLCSASMAHIDLGNDMPGIRGLLAYRPETAVPLGELAEILLRGDNSLSRGERELIGAYVSRLNECVYCASAHTATAAAQLPGGTPTVEQVLAGADTAPVSGKLRALLNIAGLVQVSGRMVTADAVAKARAEGATDAEIHDTVLIAAAFCMYNRYVDGLGTPVPGDPAEYAMGARALIEHGYRPPPPAG